ncbi:MAG: hypothetical protein PHI57_07165 [Bacteroidales bacterium]|nr:hypothetical protein [Bacteroidales bacterium]
MNVLLEGERGSLANATRKVLISSGSICSGNLPKCTTKAAVRRMKLESCADTLSPQNNLDVNELLKLDDPVLEALLSAGTPAYLDARFNVFKEQIPYLEKCNKQISDQRFSEKFNQQFSDSDSRPDRVSSLHGV